MACSATQSLRLSMEKLMELATDMAGWFKPLDDACAESEEKTTKRSQLAKSAKNAVVKAELATSRLHAEAEQLRRKASAIEGDVENMKPSIRQANDILQSTATAELDADFRQRVAESNAASEAAHRGKMMGALTAVAGVVSTCVTGTPIVASAISSISTQVISARANVKKLAQLPEAVKQGMTAADQSFLARLETTGVVLKDTVQAVPDNIAAVLAEVDRVRKVAGQLQTAIAAADGDPALNAAAEAAAAATTATEEQRQLVLDFSSTTQNALRQYSHLCRLRNDKSAEAESLKALAERLDNERFSLLATIAAEQAIQAWAMSGDLSLTPAHVFLTSAAAVVCRSITRTIRQWWSAREYTSLPPMEEVQQQITAWDPSVARHAHVAFWLAQMTATQAQDMAVLGQEQHEAHGIQIPFRWRAGSPGIDADGVESEDVYSAVVDLQPRTSSDFNSMWRVQLSTIEVRLQFADDSRPDNTATVVLTHLGNAIAVAKDESQRAFLLKPITYQLTAGQHDADELSSDPLGSSSPGSSTTFPSSTSAAGRSTRRPGRREATDTFLPVCPFATWVVRVPKALNQDHVGLRPEAKLVLSIKYDPTEHAPHAR